MGTSSKSATFLPGKRGGHGGWIGWRRVVLAAAMVLLTNVLGFQTLAVKAAAAPILNAGSPPMFAYYYIWHDANSWNHAKIDYPLLGRYSSDDVDIMRKQVEMAKAAGIQGFIVSWKDTPVLTPRLEKLIQVAEAENFKLVLIYEGLDVQRKALPVDKVAADLSLFAKRYASRAPFNAFGRPVAVWSGTWEFSPQEVAQVTGPLRSQLRILASARSADEYKQIANSVDGDAYYWSSLDPSTYKGYAAKLRALSDAVHANKGLWFAPAAPGFDARLIGGTRTVDRKDGDTFRQELAAAAASSPDVIAVISWNEYTENSEVEPSVNNGNRALEVLSSFNGVSKAGTQPNSLLPTYPVMEIDSNWPGTAHFQLRNVMLLGALGVLFVGSLGVIIYRGARKS